MNKNNLYNRLYTWIQQADETLLDLIFGCIVYCILVEIMGLILAKERIPFTIGLILGLGVAIWMCISMYKGLDACLSMQPGQAEKGMKIRAIKRWIVMFVAAWTGLRFHAISFAGVVIGLFSLKISAHIHVYTNLYITKKIRKKGR